MIKFINDYQEGCIPEILEKLQSYNLTANVGYGLDEVCERARELIKTELKAERANVHFISGGTLTNKIVITTFL